LKTVYGIGKNRHICFIMQAQMDITDKNRENPPPF